MKSGRTHRSRPYGDNNFTFADHSTALECEIQNRRIPVRPDSAMPASTGHFPAFARILSIAPALFSERPSVKAGRLRAEIFGTPVMRMEG